MKLKTIELPREYKYKEGESRPEYKKYDGWNKISYSQYTSFKDNLYKGGYFYEKFLNLKEEQGIFAYYGNAVGDYLNRQDQRVDEYLTDEDKKIIDAVELPDNSVFEYEILIDLEPFGLKKTVLQGFSDFQYEVEPKLLDVGDAKTLNLDKKREFYESDEYQQTNVYGYGLEELGYKINETYLIGFGRKGNSLEQGAKYPIKLSGRVERIEHPYNRERAKQAVQDIADTCIEVHEYYQIYKKYFL